MRSPGFWSKILAALALFLGGWATIPSFLLVGLALGCGAASFGLWAKHERDRREISDGLGDCLGKAFELQDRTVSNPEAFKQWEQDYETWFQSTHAHILKNLSKAQSQVFRDLSEGGSYTFRGAFGPEHIGKLNNLRKYVVNLREITTAYLASND